MFEALAQAPSPEAENASEFRYRDPVINPATLVISVSQSGETVDTLAAMEEAKSRGAGPNRRYEQRTQPGRRPRRRNARHKSRGGDWSCQHKVSYQFHIGPLSGSLLYGDGRGGLISGGQVTQMVDDLARLPSLISRALETDNAVREIARRLYKTNNYLYLGRGISYPVAMEGALKLKEISYCHAEGYQAGEMKHGPIALIDEDMPVVALALRDRLYPKMLGNIEEVKARDGKVIAIATEGDEDIAVRVDHVIHVPPAPELLSPLVSVIPLQLFAYHVAVIRGCDVDQPRNLAKSVTVE